MRFTSSPPGNAPQPLLNPNSFYDGGLAPPPVGAGGGGFVVPGYQNYGAGLAVPQQMPQPHPQGMGRVPIPQPQPVSDNAGMGFNMGGMWGVNDATAQMGMQLGKSAVHAGQEYVQKSLGLHLPMTLLKHQFNVSNSYVLRKVRLVLFPWRHRPWTRKFLRSETNGQSGGWEPPRDDINSPDLYIPVMALVTYILMAGLQTGLEKRFNPEVLGMTASKALAVLIMEFSFIKLGCYFLNIQGQGQVVDIFAYGGYKFVGIILTLFAGILHLGRTLYWVVFIYAFSANAFFLLRSLRYVVLPDPAAQSDAHTLNHAQRSRRIKFLFLIALSQLLYMGILVWL
jgi:hypothetical protein